MHTKNLNQLTLTELADIHLSKFDHRKQLKDGWIQSGMGLLAVDMSQSLPRVDTGFFSPLYSAFSLLDQIGEIYSDTRKGTVNPEASGIKKALFYFCNQTFNDDVTQALYGLRNSLMHNGSLIYRGRFEKGAWKGPFHWFAWDKTLTDPLQLPATPWDGILDNLKHENRTKINVSAICSIALQAIDNARLALDAGKLGITIGEGEQELYYRYLFHSK